MPDKSAVIAQVCERLASGDISGAKSILKHDYPFAPKRITERRYSPVESTRVFIRDGFIDRYTGERLIFPAVLRILSATLPEDFPFHPNWKTDRAHAAYWAVSPTIDHVIPVSHGGADDESNWVTTSMTRNSAKLNWGLDEIGWQLYAPGDIRAWDGLLQWFLDYTAEHPEALTNASVRKWHRAAMVAMTDHR